MSPTASERKMAVTLKAPPGKSGTQVRLDYPAIYESTCAIDIRNFPFDKQARKP